MFRLTHFLHELQNPTPVGPRRDPPGPVVIWNLVRRCNLKCRHCYAVSADVDFPGELSTEQVFAVMDDLKAARVPALILSGGEPLLRPDIFEISQRARDKGFYTALSSNGTLIDRAMAKRIAAIGYDYVGVSLDGIGATHDRFRGKDGSFDEALAGLRILGESGVKTGLRFTMTSENYRELPAMVELAEKEGIDKFYLSHLVYAGRGNKHRADDVGWPVTRTAMDLLIETAWQAARSGHDLDIVTGNNDADAVYFLGWAAERFPADRVAHLREHLESWGGNSSGLGVANIDTQGIVHPDTYWSGYAIDSVRNRPFSEIWQDLSDPMLAGLRARPRPLKGRCGACAYKSICGGNTRIRALQLTGDPWEADPACYLSDGEIGLTAAAPTRAEVTPFRGQRHDPAHRYV